MKFDFNRKYNTIAAYTLIVIAIGAAIVIGISNISQVGAFLSKIFSHSDPFSLGIRHRLYFDPCAQVLRTDVGTYLQRKIKAPAQTDFIGYFYLSFCVDRTHCFFPHRNTTNCTELRHPGFPGAQLDGTAESNCHGAGRKIRFAKY